MDGVAGGDDEGAVFRQGVVLEQACPPAGGIERGQQRPRQTRPLRLLVSAKDVAWALGVGPWALGLGRWFGRRGLRKDFICLQQDFCF